jgi:hypothetical protein
MRKLLVIAAFLPLAACATQRYGRMTDVSTLERQELNCREIRIEMAKADEFLKSVRTERAGTNGAHVLGFLGDFGIGNVMEGNAAEASGLKRQQELRGHRQVVGPERALQRATRLPSPSCCHLDARLLPPHPEGFIAGMPVLIRGHQVPPWAEMAIDHGVR